MRFTTSNTEGYEAADLAEMNRAFQTVCMAGDLPTWSDDLGMASLLDHIAEGVLAGFDSGHRGTDLVCYVAQR